MGQRSQIYVRYNNKLIIANYYQWNYGERMISRARYGIEHLQNYVDNGYDFVFSDKSYITKMSRIFDTNFDMKDIVVSSNIISDYIKDKKDGYINDVNFNQFAFYYQDNNDGKLFIDIQDNKIKYAFTDWNCKTILDPEQYMVWDMDKDWKNDLKEHEEKNAIKICEENMKEISKMANLMTMEELEDFINHDYQIDFNEY